MTELENEIGSGGRTDERYVAEEKKSCKECVDRPNVTAIMLP
jgi:hypothetical protein